MANTTVNPSSAPIITHLSRRREAPQLQSPCATRFQSATRSTPQRWETSQRSWLCRPPTSQTLRAPWLPGAPCAMKRGVGVSWRCVMCEYGCASVGAIGQGLLIINTPPGESPRGRAVLTRLLALPTCSWKSGAEPLAGYDNSSSRGPAEASNCSVTKRAARLDREQTASRWHCPEHAAAMLARHLSCKSSR